MIIFIFLVFILFINSILYLFIRTDNNKTCLLEQIIIKKGFNIINYK